MDSTQENTQGNIPLQCFTLNKCNTNSIVKIRVFINCGNAPEKNFLIKCCEKKTK